MPRISQARLQRIAVLLLALVLGGLFVYKDVQLIGHYHRVIADSYNAKGVPELPSAGDLTVFYTAGKMAASDERSSLYDPKVQVLAVQKTQGWPPNDPDAGDGAWSKFYNPPFYAFLMIPLSLFGVHTAYLIAIGVNVIALLVLGLLIGRILDWRQPATLLIFLGLVSFTPLYFAFQHAQPTIILAIILGASFLLLEQRRLSAASWLLAFAGLKPQWLALPGAVLAGRDRRILAPMVLAVLVVVIAPFVLIGPQGFFQWIDLILGRGSGDLTDPNFSSAVLSWSGFVRAAAGTPQPVLWVLLAAITGIAFVLVWGNGEPRFVAASSMLTTLLVVPHSHPQDWVVMGTIAAFVFSRPMAPGYLAVTIAIFLGIHISANDWPAEIARVGEGQREVYWVTPASCLLLFWLALVPVLESRTETVTNLRARFDALPLPSMARQVRAWHVGAVTFALGLVLGIGATVALVQEKGPAGPTQASAAVTSPALALRPDVSYFAPSGPVNEAVGSAAGMTNAEKTKFAQPEGSESSEDKRASNDAPSAGAESDQGKQAVKGATTASSSFTFARPEQVSDSASQVVDAGTTVEARSNLPLPDPQVAGESLSGESSDAAASASGWTNIPQLAGISPSAGASNLDEALAVAEAKTNRADTEPPLSPAGTNSADMALGETSGPGRRFELPIGVRQDEASVGTASAIAAGKTNKLPSPQVSGLSPSEDAIDAAGAADSSSNRPPADPQLAAVAPSEDDSKQAEAEAGGRTNHQEVVALGTSPVEDQGEAQGASTATTNRRQAEVMAVGVSPGFDSVLATANGAGATNVVPPTLARGAPPAKVEVPAPSVSAAPASVPGGPEAEPGIATSKSDSPAYAAAPALSDDTPPPGTGDAVAAPNPTPAPRPTAVPTPAPSVACTRVAVARPPSISGQAGGVRVDVEMAAVEPAGCTTWPEAFGAQVKLNLAGGAYAGSWNCDSGRNSTRGTGGGAHLLFFCIITGSPGPASGGPSSAILDVTTYGAGGAVTGQGSQSFGVAAP